MSLTISSTAFSEGERIPDKYTCEGEDISPQLTWRDAPEGTKSFSLICDDPDAPMGTWDHWLIYNIPADSEGLSEAVPTDESLTDGSKQGLNSWEKKSYGGPCPPPGDPHRYFFKLYALDTMLTLTGDVNKSTLENAMQEHILAEAQLMGTFSR
ncbi:MAG: YbhB/YbcL family Raf kinase inhibitor-like protein [Candidatus Marinimicrobia bacterium]|nr:YbhB/YbcL family Raf kinase inhibitor-like protein [Candidatus Neomarinimicrobiota bacterium]